MFANFSGFKLWALDFKLVAGTVSTKEFQAPQSGHLPAQREEVDPQDWQTN